MISPKKMIVPAIPSPVQSIDARLIRSERYSVGVIINKIKFDNSICLLRATKVFICAIKIPTPFLSVESF